MEIKILSSKEIDREIANIFIKTIKDNPSCILGLATGSSPLGVYRLLVEAYQNNEVSFKDVTSFNLDEYLGLDGSHNQSYRYFMNHNLFNHIDINKDNTHVPSGLNVSEENAANYDAEIEAAGGIDLQILGIGSNGHIAFNEPGTPLNSLTHVVKLDESTRNDNARFFESIDEVPTHAVSMGLASIMKAKKIVLIATGPKKAQAIKALVEGDVTSELPVSVLKNHKDATIYVDEEAASLISFK